MKINKNIAKRMSKLQGTIRRKEFALKTKDEIEALQKAEEIDAIYMASTLDVALAQIERQ